MEVSNIVNIPSFFGSKIAKKLTFTDQGIKIETAGPTIIIPAENINAFRYRISWTRGYKFVFGRQYIIETRDFNNKIFEIKLNSIYGIKRKAYYEAWSQIYQLLWKYFFDSTLNYYSELYKINQVFEVAGVNFDTDGISWDKKNKLLWNEIAISNYRTYFMIYNKNNIKQTKSCSFANDWNASILQVIIKGIVNQQKQITGTQQ
jgi:hypothetical protein